MTITFYTWADLENRDEETALPLYWSDNLGWVDESHASLYPEHLIDRLGWPTGQMVVQIPVTVKFPCDL